MNIFAFEYSGYGHATGTPSEDNMYSDGHAALFYIEHTLKLRLAADVIMVGQSLGTCCGCALASQRTFRGLLLISGLASGARVLWPETKLPPLDAVAFNNLAMVRRCTCPVQIIHGAVDTVIPESAAVDMHKACSARHPFPLVLIAAAAHNLEATHPQECLNAITVFLAHVQSLPAEPDDLLPGLRINPFVRALSFGRKSRAAEPTPTIGADGVSPLARALSFGRKPRTADPTPAAGEDGVSPLARALSFGRKPRAADPTPTAPAKADDRLPSRAFSFGRKPHTDASANQDLHLRQSRIAVTVQAGLALNQTEREQTIPTETREAAPPLTQEQDEDRFAAFGRRVKHVASFGRLPLRETPAAAPTPGGTAQEAGHSSARCHEKKPSRRSG